ncbi:hypothetical protein [Chryseobacterium paludis]|uniref:hypothetical protein n=1 Tax=Chryseobacterium paludis TaxID=2956784 RepID=UPI0021C11FCB|nr:hypothetical protein [Chryseobacterium paludis]
MNEKKKQVLRKVSIRKYLYAFLLFSLIAVVFIVTFQNEINLQNLNKSSPTEIILFILFLLIVFFFWRMIRKRYNRIKVVIERLPEKDWRKIEMQNKSFTFFNTNQILPMFIITQNDLIITRTANLETIPFGQMKEIGIFEDTYKNGMFRHLIYVKTTHENYRFGAVSESEKIKDLENRASEIKPEIPVKNYDDVWDYFSTSKKKWTSQEH